MRSLLVLWAIAVAGLLPPSATQAAASYRQEDALRAVAVCQVFESSVLADLGAVRADGGDRLALGRDSVEAGNDMLALEVLWDAMSEVLTANGQQVVSDDMVAQADAIVLEMTESDIGEGLQSCYDAFVGVPRRDLPALVEMRAASAEPWAMAAPEGYEAGAMRPATAASPKSFHVAAWCQALAVRVLPSTADYIRYSWLFDATGAEMASSPDYFGRPYAFKVADMQLEGLSWPQLDAAAEACLASYGFDRMEIG
jgi:hypothetical protein